MMKIKSHKLAQEHFQTYPVWGWNLECDDESSLVPIQFGGKRLPEDFGSLFVTADFVFNNGDKRIGHVVTSHNVFAIGIWNFDHYITVNMAHKDNYTLDKLKELKLDLSKIFPLRYSTNYFLGEMPLRGVFNFISSPEIL
jgi:hypothetical protein